MRILWIGYGQAGGKLINALMGMKQKSYQGIAINTENADLAGLKKVNDRVIIGKYKQKGRGVGADLDLGAEIAQKSLSLMMDRIDRLGNTLDPEAFWIVSGLAGGTGAGGAHILADELKSIFHIPVYGMGVLPSTSGMPPEKEVLNLSNSLTSFERWQQYFDNILLIDNQQYERRDDTRESLEEMYERINTDIARRLTLILTAGEAKHPPQEVLSTPEIKATLGTQGDISTIGYRGEDIRLRTRFWKKGIEPDERRLEEIIEGSISRESLTFPCDIKGSSAAALVPYGRPKHLFTQAIIAGKAYIEKMLGVAAVRYGDYPDTHSGELAAITLISGIPDFARLDQMRKRIQELS